MQFHLHTVGHVTKIGARLVVTFTYSLFANLHGIRYRIQRCENHLQTIVHGMRCTSEIVWKTKEVKC